MDAKTLTALTQSIEKWERNAVAETPDDFRVYVSDCALCDLFWPICNGCPVQARSGRPDCAETPYTEATASRQKWRDDPSNDSRRAKAQAAARAEVEFLRSLLPEEEPTP